MSRRTLPPHRLVPGDYLEWLRDTVKSVSDVWYSDNHVAYRTITLSSGREVTKREGELCRVGPQPQSSQQPRPSTREVGSTKTYDEPIADRD